MKGGITTANVGVGEMLVANAFRETTAGVKKALVGSMARTTNHIAQGKETGSRRFSVASDGATVGRGNTRRDPGISQKRGDKRRRRARSEAGGGTTQKELRKRIECNPLQETRGEGRYRLLNNQVTRQGEKGCIRD